MQEFIKTIFTNTKLEDLFVILFQLVESSSKKHKEIISEKDDYPDKVKRTVTQNHTLQRGRREGNKLAWTEQFYIHLMPGRKDLTGAEIAGVQILNDALSFTGYQIRDDVLLEIAYLDTWQELLNNTLAELRLLYPEPAPIVGAITPLPDETAKSKTLRKSKKKIPSLPTRPANLLLWVNTWEVIEPQIKTDKTLRIDIQNLIQFLYLQNRDDIISKEDTLRKIIACGQAGKINRAELERKKKM